MFKNKFKSVLKHSSNNDANAKEAVNQKKGNDNNEQSENPSSGSKFKSMRHAFKSSTITEVPTINSGMSRIFHTQQVSLSGIRGTITTMAFEQTQGLLAVATTSKDVHIFGNKEVEVVMSFEGKDTIKELRFVKGIYLLVISSKDIITIISLYSKQILTSVFAPGKLISVETDPSLDWILMGLQSGTLLAYDVDRDQMCEFRVDNIQKLNFFKQSAISPIVSIQWNPRDIGTVLISYEQSTIIFSLIENTVKQHFIYELPPDAPGGDYSFNTKETRYPKVIQSLFHPNSLHILTIHEDNSLCFWDANTGKLILARTILETQINKPQIGLQKAAPVGIPKVLKAKWVCANNPEYTSLAIAYQSSSSTMGSDNNQNLIIFDFGGTPSYTVTTYDGMKKYYSKPRGQKIVPLIQQGNIIDMLPIPRASPFFAGCHDPAIILLLFDNGELGTMIFPKGLFTTKASLLPQNLCWLRPPVTMITGISVPKKLWLGMMTSQRNEQGLLKGGLASKKEMRLQTIRSAIATGHVNGTVRIWDASQKELEDNSVFEVNLGSIINTSQGLAVTNISFSPDTLELAVSVESGNVILFKYEMNQYFIPDGNTDKALEIKLRRFSLNDSDEVLVDVRDRASTSIKKGFLPSTAVHACRGKVTALKNSGIGFVGIAYQDGSVIVIDRRGPATMYFGNVNSSKINGKTITAIEFCIMEYGTDGYSSILMLAGSDSGELFTYKILPAGGSRFSVELIEVTKTNEPAPVLYIGAVDKSNGQNCSATIAKMDQLSSGIPIPGTVFVVTSMDARTVKLGKSKDSGKTFKYPVLSSSLSFIPYIGSKGDNKLATVLVSMLANGDVKVLSTPDLKDVKTMHIGSATQAKYIPECSVLTNGDIIIRNGTHSAGLYSTVDQKAAGLESPKTGRDSNSKPQPDTLYNPTLHIPYRPQVNSMQWARGTVYVTDDQLSEVLSGKKRPPSKYKESEIAKGTITLAPPKKSNQKAIEEGGKYRPEDMTYKSPVRHTQRSGGYDVIKAVTRTVETQYDYVESQFNEYTTALGNSLNEAVEDTSKDLMKSAIGI
ncbi:hypothetical protein TPHA_0E00610 [Tetrapisispora phaffii CBS 4417]|uniref:Lethal giant larvae (Lgl)-like C-terminal domain-containing protein n=1 Tax=Tetrapisispora phaffii (strain ATCC 24235 / CBS 4417 / NBRC 1672 / NRRL Y-8282 / UCD 70-5) TaxID=1071381 RepID=G8BTC8_TETPH|nr:hypothetical protein TPHA_0E00610 [Tetrapisispora phaffii CBS 4417]CCE63156.1 hypothetical protein TPHA_0E00610 [Tetrapisispora phaffii CBS 4417]